MCTNCASSVEALKSSSLAVWDSITVEEVCAACGSAVKRFKAVVTAKGGHFEI